MKITTTYLRQVIKEEVQKVLKEQKENMMPGDGQALRDLAVEAYIDAGEYVRDNVPGTFDPKTGIVTIPEKNHPDREYLKNSILKRFDPNYPNGEHQPYYLQDRLNDALLDLQKKGLFTGDEDTIHTINLNF